MDFDPKCSGDITGKFIKIRVGVDISTPLRRWINLDIEDGVSKLQLDYEELPYFCLFCGRLSHFSVDCPLEKEGLITEPRYGRSPTLAKHVFNIDPTGELTGASSGITRKKTGWRMTAPEPTLSGNVRTREELELIDPCTESHMEVDQLVNTAEADFPQSQKRRRVDLGSSETGAGMGQLLVNSLLPCPILKENIQTVTSVLSDLLPQENIFAGGMASQELSM